MPNARFASILLVVTFGCSTDEPELRYDAKALSQREIITSARLRSEHQDLVKRIAAESLTGAAAERALAERTGTVTAVQLDDKSIWYPAGRTLSPECTTIDSLAEFEVCVLAPRELAIDNPAHLVWARKYLAALGVTLDGYDGVPGAEAEAEACDAEPFVPVPDWWPQDAPTNGELGDTLTTAAASPYSSTCPCIRKTVATKEVYTHTNPETYLQYKHKASGALKWEKSGAAISGDYEATGEKKSAEWTIETVTCYAQQEDRGTKDNPWFGTQVAITIISPFCSLATGLNRCTSCQRDSGEYVYGFENYRTALMAFDPKKGEFTVAEKRESPCKAPGHVHREETF